MLDFPDAPTLGTEFNGFTWNGYGWAKDDGGGGGGAPVDAYTKAESEALFVNVPGDTMTGALVLPAAAPTAPEHAANKAYVDTHLTQAEADTIYVNVTGDTMTGRLTAPGVTVQNDLLVNTTITSSGSLVTTTLGGTGYGAWTMLSTFQVNGWTTVTGMSCNGTINIVGVSGSSILNFCDSVGNIQAHIDWGGPPSALRIYHGAFMTTFDNTNGDIGIPSKARLGPGVTNCSQLDFVDVAGAQYAHIDYPFAFPALRFYAGAYTFYMETSNGIIVAPATAQKPGGGPWDAASDARIKTVLGDYTQGLAALKQITPVRYRYSGNHVLKSAVTSEDDPMLAASTLNTTKEYVGLVAQDVEAVMPEMVSLDEGFIDGTAVADLRTLDSNALTYALINAVKELSAEIEALKAQLPAARR